MIASADNIPEPMLADGHESDRAFPAGADAISTLAGGIAHQFNNALVAIVGSIDLLQLDFSGSPEVEKYARNMRSAVKKMTRLTEQLLAYARLGNYQPRIISLNEIVEVVYPEIVRGIGPDVRVEKNLGATLPETFADPTQMQMVISALVENSKEAMEGSGCIRITTREEFGWQRDGSCVCLKVADTGKGMSESVMERMFEPFFTTKLMGRGLSMAAVYGIVKNHDGLIRVESNPGVGTTVGITLPAVSTAAPR